MNYNTEAKIISEITEKITSGITDIDEYDEAYDKIRTIISEQFKNMNSIMFKYIGNDKEIPYRAIQKIEDIIFDTSYMITSEIAEIHPIEFNETFEMIEKIITENMN